MRKRISVHFWYYYATLTGYSKDILGSLRPLSRTVTSEPFRVDLMILGLLVLDVSIQNMKFNLQNNDVGSQF